jgi:hypothetical protein
MNHITTDPALPDSDPYAVIRQRIALARRRLDNLFSLISVGVLLLMPVLFAVAHIAADGAVWNFATGEKFSPMFNVMSSYFKTLRSSWIHQHGIGGAQVLIILTIMGSRFLWERRGPDRRFWSRAQWVALLFVVGGICGRLWFPDLNGVTQRVAYFGIYLWMLIIVREIEQGRKSAPETSGAGDANEMDESGQVVQVP